MPKKVVLLLLVAACLQFASADEGQTAETPTRINPLLVGSQAPDATMTDPEGKSVTLKQLASGKPSVIVFYRGSW